jgi:hypothetical protein
MATKYERLIINPILKVIEKKQDYLCQPENLPQLAKLGFMFNNLWYAGRVCYGYGGIVRKGSTCENNPKYELGDNIEYNSEENENLIYDAWGMHVSNDGEDNSYDVFRKTILEGKELSDFEKESRKPNKTFDEWVNILTDKRYRYHSIYPNRRSVANHLLCVIGNGYGYNPTTGMVFTEASGADQDEDLYGEWENSIFEPSILEVVTKILDVPECKLALDAYSALVIKSRDERLKTERDERVKWFGYALPLINKERVELGKDEITLEEPDFHTILNEFLTDQISKVTGNSKPEIKPYEYYPLSDYSIIWKFDEKTHPSYIQAGMEICEHIVANNPEIGKDFNEYQTRQRDDGIEFCKNFIKRFGKVK